MLFFLQPKSSYLCNEGLVGVVKALLAVLAKHHCVHSTQPLQRRAQGLVGKDRTHREDVLALQPVVLHDAGEVVDQQLHEGLDVVLDVAVKRGAGREQGGQLAPACLVGNLG